MAKVKKEDIKDLTTKELQEKVEEMQLKLQKTKFNHAVSQLDNPLLLRSMRKDVARLNTELNARLKAEKQG